MAADTSQADLPIAPLSLAAKLPPCTYKVAVTRIRGTINSYCDKAAELGWIDKVKLGTLQALQRRLAGHEGSIVGQENVDMEIAFTQLTMRVGSMVQLKKLLLHWNETQSDAKIHEGLDSFAVVMKYLEAREARLAPDLSMLRYVMAYKQAEHEGKSVVDAMKCFDYPAVVALHEEYLALIDQELARPPRAKATITVKVEDAGDDEVGEPSEKDRAAERAAKRRKVQDGPLLFVAAAMRASPEAQLCRLVTKSVMGLVFKLPSAPEGVDPTVHMIEDVAARYEKTLTEESKLPDLCRCVASVIACLRSDEAARPPVAVARASRKEVLAAVTMRTTESDLCKAMTTYDAGKLALQAALNHSKAGIDDEVANCSFVSVVDSIEGWLQELGDDPLLQLCPAGADSAGLKGFHQTFHMVTSGVVTGMLCLKRWSASGLTNMSQTLVDTIQNMGLVCQLGNLVLLDSCWKELHGCLGQLTMLDTSGGAASDDPGGTAAKATPCAVRVEPPATDKSDSDHACFIDVKLEHDEAATAMPIIGKLAAAAVSLGSRVAEFSVLATEATSALTDLHSAYLQRTGAGPGIECSFGFQQLRKCFDKNFETIGKVCKYLGICGRLSSLASPSSTSDLADAAASSDLVYFCKVHHGFSKKEQFELLDDDSLDYQYCHHKEFQKSVGYFVKTTGQELYERHGLAGINGCLAAVSSCNVGVRVVHAAVVEQATLDKLFVQLITHPPANELAENGVETCGAIEAGMGCGWGCLQIVFEWASACVYVGTGLPGIVQVTLVQYIAHGCLCSAVLFLAYNNIST